MMKMMNQFKRCAILPALAALVFASCMTPPAEPNIEPTKPVQRVETDVDVRLLPGSALVLGGDESAGPTQAIEGVRGERIMPTDVEITFTGERLAETIEPGTQIDWITNLPRGLRARIREARRDSTRIVILVDGVPQVTLNERMNFALPASALRGATAFRFSSDEAKFEIRQGNIDVARRTEAASAEPAYVYVNGFLGSDFETVDLRVNFQGTFPQFDIEEETPVDWVQNLPAGLNATVQPLAAGAANLTLTVRGRPTEAATDLIQVLLPADFIGDVYDFAVPNETLKWRILGAGIGDALVDGSVGSAIAPKNIRVNLEGAAFASDLAPGQTVTWITNLPSGLTARVRDVRAGDRTGIITVSGTPTIISTEVLEVSVPAEFFDPAIAVPVRANVDARFAINDNTRQIAYAEVSTDSSAPNWLGGQRGPLNVPVLPSVKDFTGIGIVTATSTTTERLGADNLYHWSGEPVNYARLIAEAQGLGAHAIINVVIDYTDSVEYRQVIREVAEGHQWSEDEKDKLSRKILTEITKDGVRFVVEESRIVTRTYTGSALAIKYLDGLSFYEAEELRAAAEANAARAAR